MPCHILGILCILSHLFLTNSLKVVLQLSSDLVETDAQYSPWIAGGKTPCSFLPIFSNLRLCTWINLKSLGYCGFLIQRIHLSDLIWSLPRSLHGTCFCGIKCSSYRRGARGRQGAFPEVLEVGLSRGYAFRGSEPAMPGKKAAILSPSVLMEDITTFSQNSFLVWTWPQSPHPPMQHSRPQLCIQWSCPSRWNRFPFPSQWGPY